MKTVDTKHPRANKVKLWLSQWMQDGHFILNLSPVIQLASLPREKAKEYVGADYRFSLSLGWLFWTVTYCFWKY